MIHVCLLMGYPILTQITSAVRTEVAAGHCGHSHFLRKTGPPSAPERLSCQAAWQAAKGGDG